MKSNKCNFGELLLIILLVFQSLSYGDLILDQVCDGVPMTGYGVDRNNWVWQEFRPTTDNLEQVDLAIGAFVTSPSVTVSFQIRDGGAVLWSTSFSADQVQLPRESIWFEIDTPKIPLVPEHSYRLYLTSNLTYEQVMNGEMVGWDTLENNPYSRGQSVFDYYYDTNDDFMFRTWAIPEPTTLSLLALGAILAGRRRKREY